MSRGAATIQILQMGPLVSWGAGVGAMEGGRGRAGRCDVSDGSSRKGRMSAWVDDGRAGVSQGKLARSVGGVLDRDVQEIRRAFATRRSAMMTTRLRVMLVTDRLGYDALSLRGCWRGLFPSSRRESQRRPRTDGHREMQISFPPCRSTGAEILFHPGR